MDGQALLNQLAAIKHQLAAIQYAESRYKLSSGAHSGSEKAAHRARRAALETIKVDLAALLPPEVHHRRG
jgi:hypothetical protein